MQVNQPLIRFEIRFQISQVQVVVPKLQQSIVQWSKDAWFLGAEVVRRNQVQGLARLRFVFVVPIRVIPASGVNHLLGRQAKEEKVFFACLLGHFDSGAVPRADGQSCVHHEFHVARAAGFIARSRDLVGDVTGRDQPLRE